MWSLHQVEGLHPVVDEDSIDEIEGMIAVASGPVTVVGRNSDMGAGVVEGVGTAAGADVTGGAGIDA